MNPLMSAAKDSTPSIAPSMEAEVSGVLSIMLLKTLFERESKRTGGSYSELYEDNEPDNKKGV